MCSARNVLKIFDPFLGLANMDVFCRNLTPFLIFKVPCCKII